MDSSGKCNSFIFRYNWSILNARMFQNAFSWIFLKINLIFKNQTVWVFFELSIEFWITVWISETSEKHIKLRIFFLNYGRPLPTLTSSLLTVSSPFSTLSHCFLPFLTILFRYSIFNLNQSFCLIKEIIFSRIPWFQL